MTTTVANNACLAYVTYVNHDGKTARRAPQSLAAILEALELAQPLVVTKQRLAEVLHDTRSRLEPEDAAERLVRAGWLAPLRTRWAWEFVPAARAGRYRSGDPFIELRAHLAHHPDAPVAVAFDSALWLHGFAEHEPSTPVFAHRGDWRPPQSLDHLRSVTYEWAHPATEIGGLPVWVPPTIVVAIADRPEIQRDWWNADAWLPEVMRATTSADVLTEAEGRKTATLLRLGYLAEWADRDDIAHQIEWRVPQPFPVTYLGPRRPRGTWVKRWRLYDALLP